MKASKWLALAVAGSGKMVQPRWYLGLHSAIEDEVWRRWFPGLSGEGTASWVLGSLLSTLQSDTLSKREGVVYL